MPVSAMSEMAPSKRRVLSTIFAGSAADCIEAAKAIVAGKITVKNKVLAEVGVDKSSEKWPRIAAIYALGFVGDSRSTPKLRKILADETDDAAVRAHAAEALGNIGDRAVVGLLRDILRHEPTPELRESCAYALDELGT
ncbi:MAG TPA: HEAT repeat domain-containing protein [Stellaceae bacterium]